MGHYHVISLVSILFIYLPIWILYDIVLLCLC